MNVQLLVGAAMAITATSIFAAPVESVERTPVSDARPLLLAALRATNGQAYGVMTGPTADAITARFAATTPINIDVTTEKRYAQPGCSRLKVTFRQDGVRMPGTTAARTETIEFGINYCLDGLPPKSMQ